MKGRAGELVGLGRQVSSSNRVVVFGRRGEVSSVLEFVLEVKASVWDTIGF